MASTQDFYGELKIFPGENILPEKMTYGNSCPVSSLGNAKRISPLKTSTPMAGEVRN